MANYCEDCGCLLDGGICSNCQEELFIQTYQSQDMDEGFSEDFQRRASEQSVEISEGKNRHAFINNR